MQDIRFTEGILRWYAESGRDLPWRRTRDPYAVWLSEIILQQTRIAQGTAYWERFMERFPTVEDLAAASEDEVLRLWQGLGYYSRARNLHAAARQIVAQGGFPSTLEGIRATPVGTTAAKKEFTALATSLLPSDAAAFNQGMMDFGAMVCTPAAPRCADCPLSAGCRAFREGRVALLPVKKPAAAVQERHLTYIYIRCSGFTAIHRRGPGDIWQGLWEPMVFETAITSNPLSVIASDPLSVIASECGQSLTLLRSGVKHQLTHRTIYADFYLMECSERPSLPPDYIWVPEAAFLSDYGKPRLVELLLAAL